MSSKYEQFVQDAENPLVDMDILTDSTSSADERLIAERRIRAALAERSERERALQFALDESTEWLDTLRGEYCYKDPLVTRRITNNRALLQS